MRAVGVAAIAAIVLCASGAAAQFDHRLLAQSAPGQPCTETTEDLGVDALDTACESGVVGVDDDAYSNTASVNSATGDLTISSLLSISGVPPFSPSAIDAIASIQERLTRTALGPIRATLQFSPAVSVAGYAVDYEVTLRLTNTCTAFFSQVVGNGFEDPPTATANCPGGSASADLNTLSVTLDTVATTIDLLAQIRADWLFGTLSSQYQIDGDLRVDALEGAAFTAPSPNFLMQVPEPGASALGLVAIVGLGVLARKRS